MLDTLKNTLLGARKPNIRREVPETGTLADIFNKSAIAATGVVLLGLGGPGYLSIYNTETVGIHELVISRASVRAVMGTRIYTASDKNGFTFTHKRSRLSVLPGRYVYRRSKSGYYGHFIERTEGEKALIAFLDAAADPKTMKGRCFRVKVDKISYDNWNAFASATGLPKIAPSFEKELAGICDSKTGSNHNTPAAVTTHNSLKPQL